MHNRRILFICLNLRQIRPRCLHSSSDVAFTRTSSTPIPRSPLVVVTRRVPRVVNGAACSRSRTNMILLPALFSLCIQHTFMQPTLAAKNAVARKSPMSSKCRCCCRRASASVQLPCGAPSSLSRIQTSLTIQQLVLQRYKSVTIGHICGCSLMPCAGAIKANESREPAANVA